MMLDSQVLEESKKNTFTTANYNMLKDIVDTQYIDETITFEIK